MHFSESFEDCWRGRYGTEPQEALSALTPFLRHRSVRKFSSEAVSEATMAMLIAAAQSASTSSNLQLWSVVSVQNADRRARIAELCANQSQIKEAAWFLAFVADHHRIARAAEQEDVEPDGLDYAEFAIMAMIDAALAAERLACAAESLGLGICYIGALRNGPMEVAQLLGLPKQTFGIFGMCLGVPSDEERGRIKPRLSQDSVWFRETYDTEANVQEYNARMAPGYEKRGIAGNWASHSGKRVDGHHMTGREVLLDFLRKQGFFLR